MCQNDEGPEIFPMVETSGQKNMFEGFPTKSSFALKSGVRAVPRHPNTF